MVRVVQIAFDFVGDRAVVLALGENGIVYSLNKKQVWEPLPPLVGHDAKRCRAISATNTNAMVARTNDPPTP